MTSSRCNHHPTPSPHKPLDLEAQGIKAAAYPTDLTDAKAVAASIAKASAELGPVGALFWNPCESNVQGHTCAVQMGLCMGV
jgi:hypothetical protein